MQIDDQTQAPAQTLSQSRPTGVFKDRRERNDRRYSDSVLRDQGRRTNVKKDRRKTNDQFSSRPWWLRVNYLMSESSNVQAPD